MLRRPPRSTRTDTLFPYTTLFRSAELSNDGSQAAMAQTFLDTGQDGRVVPRLDIDHTVWRKAGLGQRRSKEVGTCEAPQHLALGARGNPGGEERGGRAVDRAVTAARDLVQRAERQAFAGES